MKKFPSPSPKNLWIFLFTFALLPSGAEAKRFACSISADDIFTRVYDQEPVQKAEVNALKKRKRIYKQKNTNHCGGKDGKGGNERRSLAQMRKSKGFTPACYCNFKEKDIDASVATDSTWDAARKANPMNASAEANEPKFANQYSRVNGDGTITQLKPYEGTDYSYKAPAVVPPENDSVESSTWNKPADVTKSDTWERAQKTNQLNVAPASGIVGLRRVGSVPR